MSESEKKASSDESWEFQLDDEVIKEVHKKTAPKSIPRPNLKTKKLKIEDGHSIRKSRTQMAKDIERERLGKTVYPPFSLRIKAAIFDYALVLVTIFASRFYYSQIEYYYIKLLSELKIDQTLSPNELKSKLLFLSTLMIATLILWLPALLYKTPGKMLFNLKVINFKDESDVSLPIRLIREIFLRPLSLMNFVSQNKEGRAISDKILGTVVQYD